VPLYFAYGSNMDRDAMRARCPGSTPVGPARLARHRLVIMREGYASVMRDPRRDVWGLLWDLALADMPALDRYEGLAGGLYLKVMQPVLAPAGSRRALVYVGRNAGPGLPRPGYMQAVIAAARSAGLPSDYISDLACHPSDRQAASRGRATSSRGTRPPRPWPSLIAGRSP
jgi:hypothetical protein